MIVQSTNILRKWSTPDVGFEESITQGQAHLCRNLFLFLLSNPLQLCHEDNDDNVVAEFYPHDTLFSSKPMEIILYQDCSAFLDIILVTCFIAEQKRRDRNSKSLVGLILCVPVLMVLAL